jgi:hypothetical protein
MRVTVFRKNRSGSCAENGIKARDFAPAPEMRRAP